MLEPSQAELISAYVDGELKPAERSSAEQLLAESDAARALAADLERLRRRVHAVPRHRLDEDFAARVIRAAEREMLLGGRTRTVTSQADRNHRPTNDPSQPTPQAHSRSRITTPLIWFTAGAAAGILAMLVGPTDPPRLDENPQIAQRAEQRSGEVEAELDLPLDEPLAQRRLETVAGRPLPDDALARLEPTTADESEDASPVALLSSGIADMTKAEDSLMEDSATQDAVTQEADDVVFVVVGLTADAARRQVVADVLRNNGIAMPAVDASRSSAPIGGGIRDDQESLADETGGADALGIVEPVDDLLLIESTPEQLAAMLSELDSCEGVAAPTQVQIPRAYLAQSLYFFQDSTETRFQAANRASAADANAPSAGTNPMPPDEDPGAIASKSDLSYARSRSARQPTATVVKRLPSLSYRGVDIETTATPEPANQTPQPSVQPPPTAAPASPESASQTPWVRSLWLLRVTPTPPPEAAVEEP